LNHSGLRGKPFILRQKYEKMSIMERSSKITLAIILGTIVIVSSYTYFVTQKSAQTALNISEAGASLITEQGESAYTDINGEPVAIDENLGKVLVVNSWASWCPACANELPNLAKLGEEFKNKNVKVLAINRAEPKSTASAFLTSVSAVAGLQLVMDPDDKFYSSIDGYAMPETIFYDPQGNIILHKRGQMTYQEMRVQTESMVNQSAEE